MAAAEITTTEDRILRYLLGGVALAAGVTGVVLLASPVDTAGYFSWGLDPPPLAALIGGSYVASFFVFGFALPRPWVEVRGLVMGTLALTLPMLASTFTHLQVFDFGRWQAWGWVLLFIASPVSFGWVLLRLRRRAPGAGAWPAPWTMIVAGAMGLGFLAVAVWLWIDPSTAATVFFPFDLPPLGGRVLGCWVSFLAFLAGWVSTHTREESWIPSLGLVAFAAGALIGAIRTLDRLGTAWPYMAVLVLLTVLGTLLLWETRRKTSH